ncbi:CFI-box-CTERM domain-containing protein [Celeribacter sp.]|uniref:CFI-box-CTERM domain-containing protein n=1 Tax=Celeribacter sp. TaxID=1890673 RepID=UPI003A948491
MQSSGPKFSRRRFINNLFGTSLATASFWGKPSVGSSSKCDMTVGPEGSWLLQLSTYSENKPENPKIIQFEFEQTEGLCSIFLYTTLGGAEGDTTAIADATASVHVDVERFSENERFRKLVHLRTGGAVSYSELSDMDIPVEIQFVSADDDFYWNAAATIRFDAFEYYTEYYNKENMGRVKYHTSELHFKNSEEFGYLLSRAIEGESLELELYAEVQGEWYLIGVHDVDMWGFRELAASIDANVERLMEHSEDAYCVKRTSCFLTTACCDFYGRPDSCLELSTLRKFRDGWLSRCKQGSLEIAEYYRIAPMICDAIDRDAARAAVLRRVYWGTILPSVALIRMGLNPLAHRLYRRMVRRLQHRYQL